MQLGCMGYLTDQICTYFPKQNFPSIIGIDQPSMHTVLGDQPSMHTVFQNLSTILEQLSALSFLQNLSFICLKPSLTRNFQAWSLYSCQGKISQNLARFFLFTWSQIRFDLNGGLCLFLRMFTVTSVSISNVQNLSSM